MATHEHGGTGLGAGHNGGNGDNDGNPVPVHDLRQNPQIMELLRLLNAKTTSNIPREKTLREHMAPPIPRNPFNIVTPRVIGFSLNLCIDHLPKFEGRANEDPNRFLEAMYVTCISFFNHIAHEIENILLLVFVHCLGEGPRDWLRHSPGGPFDKWGPLREKFLERYDSPSRTVEIRRELLSISQHVGETLGEYFERFTRLCIDCPHHEIPDAILMYTLVDGLKEEERSLVNAASGGSLYDMTPSKIRELMARMARESHPRDGSRLQTVTGGTLDAENLEATISSLLDKWLSPVLQSLEAKIPITEPCGFYRTTEHATDECPVMRQETICAARLDEPNFDTRGDDLSSSSPRSELDTIADMIGQIRNDVASMKTNIENMARENDETRRQLKHLETTVNHLATEMKDLRVQNSGRLLSQPQPAIGDARSSGGELSRVNAVGTLHEPKTSPTPPIPKIPTPDRVVIIHRTPRKIASVWRYDENNKNEVIGVKSGIKTVRELYAIFKKKKANRRYLEVIKKDSHMEKDFEEMCAKMAEFRDLEKVEMKDTVSTVIANIVPKKEKDPGMFGIKCRIGKKELANCMMDLGAAINILALSTYYTLGLGPLKETPTRIVLADGSVVTPKGVVEDVLVEVEGLAFPADFFIIGESKPSGPDPIPIIFGRPFMSTSHAVVDVFKGRIEMEFGGRKICLEKPDQKDKVSDEMVAGAGVLSESDNGKGATKLVKISPILKNSCDSPPIIIEPPSRLNLTPSLKNNSFSSRVKKEPFGVCDFQTRCVGYHVTNYFSRVCKKVCRWVAKEKPPDRGSAEEHGEKTHNAKQGVMTPSQHD